MNTQLAVNLSRWHRRQVTAPYSIGILLAAIALGTCVVGCDNARGTDVPSEKAEATPSEAPELEVPLESSEKKPPEVVVWVNGDPLEKSEVDRQIQQLQTLYGAQRRPLEGQQLELKRRLITERLIDRNLLDQWRESRERPIVTTNEVDNVLATQVAERFGSKSVLERHLNRRGATLSEYRTDLRRSIELRRMLAAGDSDPGRSDAGVADTFEDILARPAREHRVRAASLFVPWPPGSDKQSVRDAVVREATSVNSLDEFKNAAQSLDASWNADFNPDIGWTTKGETAGDVGQTLFNTETGRATEAVSTPLGVQVFFVLERESSDSPQFAKHRDTLKQHLRERDFLERKQKLVEKLRTDAVLRWNETSGSDNEHVE